MDMFLIIYAILEILGTYTTYRLMRIFHENTEKNRTVESMSYIGFYIAGMIIYLYAEIPAMNLIVNMLMLFLVTYNYRTSIRKKVLSVILIYAMALCVETIILLLVNYVYPLLLTQSSYASLWVHTCYRIIFYMFMLFWSKVKSIKKGEIMSQIYWFCLIAVPSFTLHISYALPLKDIDGVKSIFVTAMIFVVNYSVFALYDTLSAQAEEKSQKLLLLHENNNYLKQFEVMKQAANAQKILQNDLENHFHVLKGLIEEDRNEDALLYMNQMPNIEGAERNYINSGNPAIDRILNVKICDAQKLGIQVKSKVIIPVNMNVKPLDMTIVLGKILDMAIEETRNLNDKEKYISIQIQYEKEMLFILIAHTYISDSSNEVQEDREEYESIRKVVDRYNGTVEYNLDDSESEVYILMIIPMES